jgi:hypothetical protein
VELQVRGVLQAIGTTRDEYGPLAGCISCQNSALERLERAAGLVTKQYRTWVATALFAITAQLEVSTGARGIFGTCITLTF